MGDEAKRDEAIRMLERSQFVGEIESPIRRETIGHAVDAITAHVLEAAEALQKGRAYVQDEPTTQAPLGVAYNALRKLPPEFQVRSFRALGALLGLDVKVTPC